MTDRLLLEGLLLMAATIAIAGVRWGMSWRANRRAARDVLDPLADGGARLLVFSSRWCGDCAEQHTVVERARPCLGPRLAVSFHDAAAESELAGRLGLVSVPALVVAGADGRILGVRHGLTDEVRFRALLARAG